MKGYTEPVPSIPLTLPLSQAVLGSTRALTCLGPSASALTFGIFAQLSDLLVQSPPQSLSIPRPLYLRLEAQEEEPLKLTVVRSLGGTFWGTSQILEGPRTEEAGAVGSNV